MLISPSSSCSSKLNKLDHLRNQIYIVTEKGCSYRTLFEKLIFEMNKDIIIKQEEYIEFWSIDAIKQCVICGFGVSVLPYITVMEEINQKKFAAQEVNIDEPLATYLSYHKDKWHFPSLRIFLEIIKAHAEVWRKESFLQINRLPLDIANEC